MNRLTSSIESLCPAGLDARRPIDGPTPRSSWLLKPPPSASPPPGQDAVRGTQESRGRKAVPATSGRSPTPRADGQPGQRTTSGPARRPGTAQGHASRTPVHATYNHVIRYGWMKKMDNRLWVVSFDSDPGSAPHSGKRGGPSLGPPALPNLTPGRRSGVPPLPPDGLPRPRDGVQGEPECQQRPAVGDGAPPHHLPPGGSHRPGRTMGRRASPRSAERTGGSGSRSPPPPDRHRPRMTAGAASTSSAPSLAKRPRCSTTIGWVTQPGQEPPTSPFSADPTFGHHAPDGEPLSSCYAAIPATCRSRSGRRSAADLWAGRAVIPAVAADPPPGSGRQRAVPGRERARPEPAGGGHGMDALPHAYFFKFTIANYSL